MSDAISLAHLCRLPCVSPITPCIIGNNILFHLAFLLMLFV